MLTRWRGSGYLLLTLPAALATMLMPPLLTATALTLILAGVGIVLLPLALDALRRWADWHRGRAAALLGESVEPRHVRLRGDFRDRWRQMRHDRGILRDIGWMFAHIGTGVPFGMLALICALGLPGTVVLAGLWWVFPAGEQLQFLGVPATGWANVLPMALLQFLLFAALATWAVPPLARVHARLCLKLLAPSAAEQMAERVDELTQTRVGALDSHAAELRRIERDLHDGTQARLVAIAMQLGVARESLTENPQAVATLLKDAHEGAEEAMTELREVIRTVYPPILADRGLSGALAALAARSGVPAQIDAGELGKLSAAVEAAAYFVVAETLTNVAKHSQAGQALVRLTRAGGLLTVEVTDDGIGGADEALGTGLSGIRRRVAALDGTVRITSPAGGPTMIEVRLPCAL